MKYLAIALASLVISLSLTALLTLALDLQRPRLGSASSELKTAPSPNPPAHQIRQETTGGSWISEIVKGIEPPTNSNSIDSIHRPSLTSAKTPPIAPVQPGSAENSSPSFTERRAKVEKAAREQAEQARIVAKVASTMDVGTTEKAEMFIQHGQGVEALQLAEDGAAINVSVPVTYVATARAEARTSNIEVEPVAGIPATQSVSSIAPTRWAWNVTPKKAGNAEILFTLTHKVSIDGKDLDLPVKHFPQKVVVSIRPWTMVTSWLSEATTMITLISTFVASAAGLLAFFRIKKSEDATK